ncbi:MAG: bifunctional UDP-N-acetylglucosamine diphosphorylase/glucosamine-1-phosphate N-acetyltransferase GlmU, partial [Candidatus Omnitrophica bacterium]|nr:bifunctional UDP-N-acetylglucosamine diphosphorylase/glucosamine-1-phosphate N-acetyltransferase GlmU [Candidatus Omnitrophota bacterium]
IVVVAGYRRDLVKRFVGSRASVVWQKKLLGSGHAVHQTAPALGGFLGTVLVLYCDTPLISRLTMARLLERHRKQANVCTLLSVRLEDPSGYGRIRRAPDGRVESVVEETDATPAEKKIQETNVGCYAFDSQKLFQVLKKAPKNRLKKEYYLTDVVGILAKGSRVEALETQDQGEVLGVNTRKDLALAEGMAQIGIFSRWIEKGVTIRDPKTTTIDADVEIGRGTLIFPHTVIEEGAVIGKDCRIGPFARIRGASKIDDGAVIGNFVEIVRSRVGRGTQIKHLSYIGDAVIGTSVNIGAGTITANFDGKRKHRTHIKDRAHIGSGTILVAPVTLGRGSKTGAGAVVTKGRNVPDRGVVVGVPAKPLQKKGNRHER